MEHFFRAMKYSWAGFLVMLRGTAFRQELGALCVALVVVGYLRGASGVFEVLPWGLGMLATESLNTGVERAVDLVTSEWHPIAKEAKDVSSFACGAMIVAFCVVCLRALVF